jgi:hypothetical protein
MLVDVLDHAMPSDSVPDALALMDIAVRVGIGCIRKR